MLGVDQVRELVLHWLQTRWRGARCAAARAPAVDDLLCLPVVIVLFMEAACCVWCRWWGVGKTLPLRYVTGERGAQQPVLVFHE